MRLQSHGYLNISRWQNIRRLATRQRERRFLLDQPYCCRNPSCAPACSSSSLLHCFSRSSKLVAPSSARSSRSTTTLPFVSMNVSVAQSCSRAYLKNEPKQRERGGRKEDGVPPKSQPERKRRKDERGQRGKSLRKQQDNANGAPPRGPARRTCNSLRRLQQVLLVCRPKVCVLVELEFQLVQLGDSLVVRLELPRAACPPRRRVALRRGYLEGPRDVIALGREAILRGASE
jgi:hypothetical protein